ncbi:hypothetical protein N9B20_01255 [Mariniblastus sp.]|nr:hypothetical protein [Mariniblastus sp.]
MTQNRGKFRSFRCVLRHLDHCHVTVPPRLLDVRGGGVIARTTSFAYGKYKMEILNHWMTGLALGLAIASFRLSLRNTKKIAALQETHDGGKASSLADED